jgi:hypothetical protein
MNTMLDARIVVARIHFSAFLAQGAPAGAAPTMALSHGNEATEVTQCGVL